MSVTLQLSPETEERLREQAAQMGESLQEYLQRLAEASLLSRPSAAALTADEWQAEFRAWVASHTNWPTHVDDSRESIYAGRGE